jgi:hypothetical protein
MYPFSVIFRGGGYNWPFKIRLLFAIRKALGGHRSVSYAQAFPKELYPIKIEDLPPTLQLEFQKRINEAERFGFEKVVLHKSDTIGCQLRYLCILVNRERDTLWNISFIHATLGSKSKSVWAAGLRTDLKDGTILLTCEELTIPKYLIKPNHKIEILSKGATVDSILRHHQNRLCMIPRDQLSIIPKEDILGFLLNRSQIDFRDFLASGVFRIITDQEVDKLKKVRFDFE